ncbi:hypothetical protein NP233_g10217 [Leucocoprinus birnbaumii]|uniref:Uncharacterized protein n=1 Tax=Leucocoprinus birnbaumii TaxID=56174 RepID=A0AAD5VLC6_9AGAR|nr:hypothetical protein NP233_g10217 [Leucocoprinus birnbaumii]
MLEARRQEIVFDEPMEHEQRRPEDDEEGLLEPRGGFDPDDDDDIQHIRMLDEVDEVDDEDDEDDRRSIATIIPHELERVDEVDEEEETHERVVDEVEAYGERADPIDPEREREGTEQRERERERQFEREAIRKQEDLNVGRPRTPEPSFGLRPEDKPTAINTSPATSSPRTRSGTLVAPKSPLSLPVNGVTNDQMLEQVLQLSAQISAMVKLTSSMESQYAAAQDTIRVLESKVGELEKAAKEKREEESESTIQDLVAKEWKKSFEGQWTEVREEWKEERERLRRAREEWENRIINLDSSLDKSESTTFYDQFDCEGFGDAEGRDGEDAESAEGGAVGGAESGGYRQWGCYWTFAWEGQWVGYAAESEKPEFGFGWWREEKEEEEEERKYREDDVKSASSQFASEEEVEEGRKVPGPVKTTHTSVREQTQTHLPTPKSLTNSVVSENEGDQQKPSLATKSPPAAMAGTAGVSFQTAGAVVVLAVAAAAVFWKVRSE